MGSCQNSGPFLGILNHRCRTIIRTQKRTLILTTSHIVYGSRELPLRVLVNRAPKPCLEGKVGANPTADVGGSSKLQDGRKDAINKGRLRISISNALEGFFNWFFYGIDGSL